MPAQEKFALALYVWHSMSHSVFENLKIEKITILSFVEIYENPMLPFFLIRRARANVMSSTKLTATCAPKRHSVTRRMALYWRTMFVPAGLCFCHSVGRA
jgi:hypothetical protein